MFVIMGVLGGGAAGGDERQSRRDQE